MMNWVTNIIAWFICVFVTVASIAISVILWLTYYDVVHNEDRAIEFSQFEEFIRNENALYAMAIIASIVAVGFAAHTHRHPTIIIHLPLHSHRC